MSTVMNVYCLGGMGVNLGTHFVKFNKKKSPGFAEIVTYFVDTSSSNIDNNIPNDQIYLVEGLDGSGKKRDSNYNPIAECSKEILMHFKPSTVNVVIHSASGGSGSVLGPVLVSEMLSRGETVIVVMVGSTGSRIEAENTLKTLKSYEVISKKREVPVIAAYRENTVEKPRGHVDSDLQTIIVTLAAIFSGDNKELDTADLKNFINYNLVTSYTPKLSLLDFFSKDIILPKGQAVISLVTLVDENTRSEVSIPVEYHSVGYLPEVAKNAITVELPIHACVVGGYFNGVVDSITAKLKTYDEARSIVTERSIVHGNESHTDHGVIL